MPVMLPVMEGAREAVACTEALEATLPVAAAVTVRTDTVALAEACGLEEVQAVGEREGVAVSVPLDEEEELAE